MNVNVGIDIGSTTVKIVVVRDGEIIHKHYERHFSKVREKAVELVTNARSLIGEDAVIHCAITGSAGLGVAKASGIDFVQEVFATRKAVGVHVPQADVVIELGGEDAKIVFLTGQLEERMNGSCAGGTGAFIDQMAILLDVTPTELDELAQGAERIYTIASRCGVFAKSDIQPLLNEGARKEDVAASIFQAVVNQTVAGLAQGREIKGDVLFLGGPLFFFKCLQRQFQKTLQLDDDHAHFPALAPYAIAAGAAEYAKDTRSTYSVDSLLEALEKAAAAPLVAQYLPPLFENDEQYQAFKRRHGVHDVMTENVTVYQGDAYLGIDCGSTTTKLVLIGEDHQILFHHYQSNKGNPADVIREQLTKLYELCGDRVHIVSSAVTGYGEALIQNAFGVDFGLVETVAHFRAARHFCPDVDFIIDIGGQDIKCFKIRNKCIDNISLNEACSSGCGSFIETFARSMGYSIEEFCKLGLFAQHPIDLGSRCTVFMNSSVKQAQKDGAGIDAISAGLSVSVVKNALYKVIRAHSPDDLGQHIVVQGGTFLNDAILRSFEQEIGRDVTRPAISGLMGAYGAALHAKDNRPAKTTLIGMDVLSHFRHTVKSARCGLCENHCSLTVNDFGGGRRFISGNRCERPLGGTKKAELPNLYKWKLEKLKSMGEPSGKPMPNGTIGIPFGLNMYELLPFWTTFLRALGFETVLSDVSTRDMYMRGQHSIPSDTVCYPAKLMHGHIENLLDKGVDAIFYPCMTYNIDEGRATNCYNCPVVAYYPELLKANVSALQDFDFMMPYFELTEPKRFVQQAVKYFCGKYPRLKKKQVAAASQAAYQALADYYAQIRIEGQKAIAYADTHGLDIAVIAGRPYHVDPEINHGIDQLIASFNMVIVSEDAVWQLAKVPEVHVLNQWTYHSRMYGAAKYVTRKENAQLIQLVSFGCGIDAITTDEMRAICEDGGKIYTQLKIDEISNLGAAKIRIRSMLAAVEEGRKLAEQQHIS
ncbi:2-hydroxyacyl-CoA dehydratase [Agathobaculum sp. NSJ-28]|uniref:2-hydroxyacyl-CoA dehydratase n=2 Tax=Agathobaculum TaxID=2048137 RepID=A0A923LU72_9FIRM|nr:MULTISPECIES: acyl-CoA dehydratase activase [Butyricicoccaceae]MBC5725396.1 2-hydroxyacyl-CoA dehydratase [Agathobaculum faecis]MCU6788809.1 acyl-CoA dehydratase activase [Agathobaculum ammoniilyticum]WOC74757.1 acyl-CoA dehydratase activase [Intestinibacillus sp. NTUH-41-i26]SCI93733.1 2-hydroxyglutaryl-CoA dehydratase component A [uncultured Butyricicoccus sp.]